MELKLEIGSMVKRTWPCLNRTFYGIETISGRCEICTFFVLIVPFMELKLINRAHDVALGGVLIVPFMELKLGIAQRLFQYGYVLIVPFMELKLNRTFYGIETSVSLS